MKRFALVMFCALSLGDSRSRAMTSVKYATYGPGQNSCGKMTLSTEDLRIGYALWVEGFVTAAGEVLAVNDVSLTETDPQALRQWVTRYCSEHPLDTLDTAAMTLVVELKTRANP